MSWSVIGIFVLLVTWGFTKSFLLGVLLLAACLGMKITFTAYRKRAVRTAKRLGGIPAARQQFRAAELARIQNLRESGLLTEEELTVQSRLLSCKSHSSFS